VSYKQFYVIGMQIRIFDREDWHENFSFNKTQIAESFIDCALKLTQNQILIQSKKVKYFLATDDEQVTSIVKQKLGEENILTTVDEGPVVHFDRSPKEAKEIGFLRILLDVWLLMNSNDFILTRDSNFGRIAGFGRQHFPLSIVNRTCRRISVEALFVKFGKI